MIRQIFGGDPRHLLKMFDAINDHLNNLFCIKISGTRFDQSIPSKIRIHQQLIYDALTDGAIEESMHENGKFLNRE